MPDDPMDDDDFEESPQPVLITGTVVLPVVLEFRHLPYFPAHVTFMDHAKSDQCPKCHDAVFHPADDVDDEEELFCPAGLDLKRAAIQAVVDQHEQALQN